MPSTGTAHWIHRARELATGVLAPAAMRVEASRRVPPEHLDLLAAEGFYGLAGLLPGPPRLRARAAEGGYVLDGTSPWVTGWGYIDTLHVAARREDDTIVWAVLMRGRGPRSPPPFARNRSTWWP